MTLFRALLLLFLVLPIVEIYVLIHVGEAIGVLPTVALVVGTALLGAYLLRRQGMTTLARARASLDAGQLPAGELMEGVFILLGGALLLTPGLVTDALGLLCLIPPLRRWMIARLIASGLLIQVSGHGGDDSHPGRVIEGEYRRED